MTKCPDRSLEVRIRHVRSPDLAPVGAWHCILMGLSESLNVSSSFATTVVDNMSRVWPVSLRCSRTAVSDALPMLSCSLILVPKVLLFLRNNLFLSPCNGFCTLTCISYSWLWGFLGVPVFV